jgi:sarcosine oxidase, subunit beta
LARRQRGRVLVLDQGEVGQGGSGRSSALVRMHYSFPNEVQLAVKSLEIFTHWPEVVGRPGDFRKTGFVRIVPPQEIDRLKLNVEMQRRLGVNAYLVTGEELKAIEPDWNVEDVPIAAYEPDSGYGDGAAVATDFLSRAREMGVEFRPRTRVTALRARGGRVAGVDTDQGAFEAGVVVAATGPWTRPLFAQLGIDIPIETEYHQVAILKNPKGLKSPAAACIDSVLNLYFRSEVGGFTLVGGFYGPRGADPDHFPQAASDESLADMAMGISRRVPALLEGGVVRGITGLYDMSPDARPLLGEAPGVSGLHVVAGFSGMGFKISPAVGLVMSELILDGEATTIDIRPFRPSRFAEGRPIKAAFEYRDD